MYSFSLEDRTGEMDGTEILRVFEDIRQCRSTGGMPKAKENAIIRFLRFVKRHDLSPIRSADLSVAIAESGPRITLNSSWPLANVHSTGAPGSLTTLLSPILVAASGFYVPLLSVRGGLAGAIDSLATIPGYNDGLSPKDFIAALRKTRLVHIGHSKADYAFADRLLWQMRDKTQTKTVRGLIAASLLGKMQAVGVRHGVIDVRVGPSGNAGSNINEALETAHTIVGTANVLGMRVSCVLSDATRLQWKKIGRMEAILSLWQILVDPSKYVFHPHIQLCIDIAGCACHAALPLTSFPTWRKTVESNLVNGNARITFIKSIKAHGVPSNALNKIESISKRRYSLTLDLKGKTYDPDLKKLSEVIKKLRQKISSIHQDHVGITVNEEEQTATVHLPRGYKHLSVFVRKALKDTFARKRRLRPIPTCILLYTGEIISDLSSYR